MNKKWTTLAEKSASSVNDGCKVKSFILITNELKTNENLCLSIGISPFLVASYLFSSFFLVFLPA